MSFFLCVVKIQVEPIYCKRAFHNSWDALDAACSYIHLGLTFATGRYDEGRF